MVYQITVDKDSGIHNDPNDWAHEHDDPKYILNLLKRVITVGMETMKIVNTLPALDERKDRKPATVRNGLNTLREINWHD